MVQKQTYSLDLVVSLCKIHIGFAALLALQVIIYDAWQLITPQAVLNRWLALAVYATVVSGIWYLANQRKDINTKLLVIGLVAIGIALASFSVYTQRGMASRAVALYALPLASAAVLANKNLLLLTAALSVVAYISTAMSYFVLNFNEGYKIELYGEVGFYSVTLFIFATILWLAIKPHSQK